MLKSSDSRPDNGSHRICLPTEKGMAFFAAQSVGWVKPNEDGSYPTDAFNLFWTLFNQSREQGKRAMFEEKCQHDRQKHQKYLEHAVAYLVGILSTLFFFGLFVL